MVAAKKKTKSVSREMKLQKLIEREMELKKQLEAEELAWGTHVAAHLAAVFGTTEAEPIKTPKPRKPKAKKRSFKAINRLLEDL